MPAQGVWLPDWDGVQGGLHYLAVLQFHSIGVGAFPAADRTVRLCADEVDGGAVVDGVAGREALGDETAL